MSVKQWIGRTHATGLMAKAGRYGGTYAHKDIALNNTAIHQMRSLLGNSAVLKVK